MSLRGDERDIGMVVVVVQASSEPSCIGLATAAVAAARRRTR